MTKQTRQLKQMHRNDPAPLSLKKWVSRRMHHCDLARRWGTIKGVSPREQQKGQEAANLPRAA